MSKKTNKPDIKKDIMKQIKSSDVHMKPQQYYLLLTVAMIGAGFLFMAIAALAISLISHDDMVGKDLRTAGIPSSRDRTLSIAIAAIILGAGVLGSYVILKKFKIGYKSQSTLLVSLLLAVIIVAALFAVQTGLASNLSDDAPFKPLAPYTADFKENHKRGVVESIDGDVIRLYSKREDKAWTILINEDTDFIGPSELREGHMVVIKGELNDNGDFVADYITITPPGKKFQYFKSSFRKSEIKPAAHL